MTTEQLIEEAVERFEKKFTETHELSSGVLATYSTTNDMNAIKDFFKKELSTIASKSREEMKKRISETIDHELYLLKQIQLSTGGRKYVKPQAISLIRIKVSLSQK